ncbi:hypothetical protein AX14_012231 [Amanita brunnescens Koide BX004]|nr:hypothetical protein AX14_012231 [Amanita brunnescens Koide BX004]
MIIPVTRKYMHSTKLRAFVLTSYGVIIEVPPVPDDLKDRKAEFGYFVDDTFLGDYHGEKGKHYSRDSKISVVRHIAEMAECYPLFHQRPPAVERLNLFKQLFSIDGDPRWYQLA